MVIYTGFEKLCPHNNVFYVNFLSCEILLFKMKTKQKIWFALQQPFDRMPPNTNECCHFLDILYRVHLLSLARSELRLCSSNHRPGYWSSLSCDWLSRAQAYSEQEAETGPRSSGKCQAYCLASKTDKKFCCNWVTKLKSGHELNYSKDTSCLVIMSEPRSVIVNA